jgi:hypothetical protein
MCRLDRDVLTKSGYRKQRWGTWCLASRSAALLPGPLLVGHVCQVLYLCITCRSAVISTVCGMPLGTWQPVHMRRRMWHHTRHAVLGQAPKLVTDNEERTAQGSEMPQHCHLLSTIHTRYATWQAFNAVGSRHPSKCNQTSMCNILSTLLVHVARGGGLRVTLRSRVPFPP